MSYDSHEEIIELLAPYALGALEPQEKSMVEAHLQECAYCRSIAHQDNAVIDSLAFGLQSFEPSKNLKRDLFAKIAVISGDDSALAFGAKKKGIGSFFTVRRWAIASVVIVPLITLGSWALFLQSRVTEVENENAQLATRVEEKEQANESLSKSISDQSQTLTEHKQALAWASQATYKKDISPLQTSRNIVGNLFINRNGYMGMILANNLQQIPQDKLYQVWLIAWNGSFINAGTFTSDRSGRGQIIIQSEQPLFTYKSLAVTIEPGPGSQEPTGPQIFGVEF